MSTSCIYPVQLFFNLRKKQIFCVGIPSGLLLIPKESRFQRSSIQTDVKHMHHFSPFPSHCYQNKLISIRTPDKIWAQNVFTPHFQINKDFSSKKINISLKNAAALTVIKYFYGDWCGFQLVNGETPAMWTFLLFGLLVTCLTYSADCGHEL